MIAATRRRLISRGEIPGSNGGIYNPGAILEGDAIRLLCRREIDYRFTPFAFPELITLDARTLEMRDTSTLIKLDYPADARIEDFRSILFDGLHLAAHTTVHAGVIRPGLSRIAGPVIRPYDDFALPTELQPIEKNWVLFAHRGDLHCVYKLDPLTIFRFGRERTWIPVCDEDNGWAAELPGTLSNSANLIPFDDGYLGFWHTIDDGRYVQGAYLLDAELRIRYRTGVLLDGREVCEGFKPGVLYVSGLVAVDDRVLAFYGEADAHTGVAVFDREQLRQTLHASPFRPVTPLCVRFQGETLGDAFRGMQALAAFSDDRSRPRIRLLVENPRLVDTVRMLSTVNVAVRSAATPRRCHFAIDGRTGAITALD